MGEGQGVGGLRSSGAVICGVGNSSLRGGHLSFWKQRTAQWRRLHGSRVDLFACLHAGQESPTWMERACGLVVWECVHSVCRASRLLLAGGGYCVLAVDSSQSCVHTSVYAGMLDTANLACLPVCTWGVHVVDKVRKTCEGSAYLQVCTSST